MLNFWLCPMKPFDFVFIVGNSLVLLTSSYQIHFYLVGLDNIKQLAYSFLGTWYIYIVDVFRN